MSLNPLDSDQKDVALAVAASYIPEIARELSGKAGSELRYRVRNGSTSDPGIDLGEPDKILSRDSRVELYDFTEDTSSKPKNLERDNGGELLMSANGEDDDYGLPEGVNQEIYEALGGLEDALYEDAQQRGMVKEEVAEEVVNNFYEEVVPAVREVSEERDDYEEELVSKIEDFEEYVRYDIESREELVEEVSGIGEELSAFAEDINLHGAVPEERAQRTSELVDEITGRDKDVETDGGFFGLF